MSTASRSDSASRRQTPTQTSDIPTFPTVARVLAGVVLTVAGAALLTKFFYPQSLADFLNSRPIPYGTYLTVALATLSFAILHLVSRFQEQAESLSGELRKANEAEKRANEKIELLRGKLEHVAELNYAENQYRRLVNHDGMRDLNEIDAYVTKELGEGHRYSRMIRRLGSLLGISGSRNQLGQVIAEKVAAEGDVIDIASVVAQALVDHPVRKAFGKLAFSPIDQWLQRLGSDPYDDFTVRAGIFNRFVVDLGDTEAVIRGRQEWLEIMMSNLVKNALGHLQSQGGDFPWLHEKVVINGSIKGNDFVLLVRNRTTLNERETRILLDPEAFTLGDDRTGKIEVRGSIGVPMIKHVVHGHRGNTTSKFYRGEHSLGKRQISIVFRRQDDRLVEHSLVLSVSFHEQTGVTHITATTSKGETSTQLLKLCGTAGAEIVMVRIDGEEVRTINTEYGVVFADPSRANFPVWAVLLQRRHPNKLYELRLQARTPRVVGICLRFPLERVVTSEPSHFSD